MTYNDAQLKATEDTQKESFSLNKEWLAVYSVLGVTLAQIVNTYYLKYLADSDNYYADSQKILRGGKYKGKTRLQGFQSEMSLSYSKGKRKVNSIVLNMSQIDMSNNYYRQLYLTQWVSDVPFTYLDKEVIDVAVKSTDEAWNAYLRQHIKKFGDPDIYMAKEGSLISRLRKGSIDELSKINSIITNGIRSGQSSQSMTKQILNDVIGITKRADGKIAFTRAKATTMRIVRSEATRLMNAGQYAQSMWALSTGLEITKLWDATLDGNTRPSHGNLDQTEKPLDEVFRIGSDVALYPGDFSETKNNANCRCRYTQIIPEVARDTRRARDPVTGKVKEISFTNFNDWVKQNNLVRNSRGVMVPKG